VDFSNEALQASEKGLQRLLEAYKNIARLKPASTNIDTQNLIINSTAAMNDDLNTPVVIAQLFEATRIINSALAGQISLAEENIEDLKKLFDVFFFDLLGMKNEQKDGNASYESFSKAVDMLLDIRLKAKQNKDWATSDLIRNELTALGFEIKDTKDGFEWRLNK
jgi:cysteinyl-tRNA synthetase